MNIKQADKKLERIRMLAEEIEDDEQLKKLDERYSITAKWIDTDIKNVSL
jgi:hypothetical protein